MSNGAAGRFFGGPPLSVAVRLILLCIVVGVIPLVLFLAVGGPIAVVGIALFVLWCVAVFLVTSTLTGIFQVALYRFATGVPVPGFEPGQVEGSFRTRRNNRGRGLFGGGNGGGFSNN